jgi:hypothetical protein
MIISKINANSCLEESMYKLKKDLNYRGSFSMTFTNGSCTSTLSNHTENVDLVDIAVSGVYGSNNFPILKIADISEDPIELN